jgi:glucose-1-phosphate cytidylyltransferase
MKGYYHQGYKDFILCLGYKGHSIRKFFMDYAFNHDDITISPYGLARKGNPLEDWNVTLVDTGEEANTALRLHKVRHYLPASRFLLTYGDGLSNVDLKKLLAFHEEKCKTHGVLATITGIHAHSKYGKVNADENGIITQFTEKPLLDDLINGGFMVLEKDFLNHLLIKENAPIEDILIELANKGKVALYPHRGFWHSMDTSKDHDELNNLWKSGDIPWKIW